MHCHTGTQRLTEVHEIYHELMGEVLAPDIHIISLSYGSGNLQQTTKMTFYSLLFVLKFMVRNITAIAPLTIGQSRTDFCVQFTLGTYPGPVWNKEATQNGFGPCGNPFHGNEEWHFLQQL